MMLFTKTEEEKKIKVMGNLIKKYKLDDFTEIQKEQVYFLYRICKSNITDDLMENIKLIVLNSTTYTDMASVGATMLLYSKMNNSK